MKNTIIAAACALLATSGLAAAPAQANSTPGCVTAREFAKIRNGMSKATVAAKFGTKGKRSAFARSGGYTAEVRSYNTCTAYGAVSISFGNGRVDAKCSVF